MKKIYFVTTMMTRMQSNLKKRHYPVEGNTLLEYDNKTYFAINSVLAKTMKSEDEIKIIFIHTDGGDKNGKENAKIFIDELNELNTVKAKIEYVHIGSSFITSSKQIKELYKRLINELEYESELSADITFGPKLPPFILFSVMQFGEKFFDCSIGNIIYQKIEHHTIVDNGVEKTEPIEGSQLICDYTPVYLLNSFTNSIECSSGEKAISAVEALLSE